MNEDPIAASQDAPPGAPAPTDSSPPPAAPNTRATSRFYSRMARGHKTAAAPAAASASAEPVSLDSLTVEQAILLKDNLPVRATAAPGAEATEFGGPRDDRPPREGRERRGRGRDRDRDRDRGDRERGDREGGRERKFERDRDRGRDRSPVPEADRPADAISPGAESAASTEDQRLAAPTPENIPPASPTVAAAEQAPRKLRFEDAPAHENQRTVQEFRPSRDRDFHREAERARHERQKRETDSASESKAPGLFGWMKSIFTPKSDEPASAPETSERPRDRDRERGPRHPGGHQGAHHQGGGHGGGEGGEHGGRRRRRRRGGRNRNRHRDGGPGGGGGAHVGGGD